METQSSWVAGVHRLGAALEAREGGPDYWLGSARYTESIGGDVRDGGAYNG